MREVERTCQHYNTYPSDLAGPIPSDLCGCQITVSLVPRVAIFTNEQATGFGSNIGTILLKSSASFTSQVGYGVTRCNNTFDLALGMMKGHNQRELKNVKR